MPLVTRPGPRWTTEAERRLILAARRGDATAQARVVSQYDPMMRLIARRLYLPTGEREDLAQEARVGLLDAVRTWDPDRGVPFSTFAWICATGEARNALHAARAHKHRVLTSASPLDAAEGTPLVTGEISFAFGAVGQRRERMRPAIAACAPCGDADPVTKTLAREQLQELTARARRLSPLERRALALATSNHSHREIAATLHTRVRAVNNALQRARHKLREPLPV